MEKTKVSREPFAMAVSPDGKYLFVSNFLPAQRADTEYVATDVSVIDLSSFTKIKDMKLSNGSNALKRWGIEILFKKMKQNFQLHYFYGENENAIYTQVWCILITQLL